MRLLLTTILSLLLLSLPLFGQSERPETIIIPVSSVGDVSNTRKIILQNTLEEQLKEHFMLISQERFEEVREKVFEELEYEECTEDRCIMMIQEMLQVENVFHLQVIGEGSDTQLSLSWRTLEEKKKVNDICMGCGTFQLNDKVMGLVEKLVGEKRVEVVVQKKPVVVVERKGKGVLYKRKVNGKWGWYKSGNEEKDGKYVGEIDKGLPNGQGTFIFENKYVWEKYVGEWKDGKEHGQGTFTNKFGWKYIGRWKNGKRHGQGTYTWNDGEKYVVEYRDGKRNGHGTYTWSNGEKYVGEYKDDKEWNGNEYNKVGNINWKYEVDPKSRTVFLMS